MSLIGGFQPPRRWCRIHRSLDQRISSRPQVIDKPIISHTRTAKYPFFVEAANILFSFLSTPCKFSCARLLSSSSRCVIAIAAEKQVGEAACFLLVMGVIRKKTITRGTEGGLKYICDVCSGDITSTVSPCLFFPLLVSAICGCRECHQCSC